VTEKLPKQDSPAKAARMKVLVFTSLYPSAAQPNLGIFVENRTRRLADAGVEVQVMAPVFVALGPLGKLKRFARDLPPETEVRHGLTVHHPRIPHLPGAWSLNPAAMTKACLGTLERLRREFAFEVIDAHFFFPDGVAAARLAERLKVPCMITARGSDVTDWPSRPQAKKMILEAARKAQALAGVSQALCTEMAALGMDKAKIHCLRNGVDLDHFAPQDRTAAKLKYGAGNKCIVSVAGLVPLKSHHITIEAVARLPGTQLLIAGEGPERAALEKLISDLNIGDRVKVLGAVAHADLPMLFNAADIFVLSSTREGLPNVVLEAISCGTPVIATPVGGTVEVLDDPRAGITYPVGDMNALALAIEKMLSAPFDRALVRKSAERFSWGETTATQKLLLEHLIK
jgi:teichuronic acid biosynthesis glycosyltransferase TuaC